MPGEVDRAALQNLPVKELRRQAAIHNVPLTHIAAAVEKSELIGMIVRAGPVKDTYDVTLGNKVHTASSIMQQMNAPPQPKQKKEKKKKKKKHSSGSSRSSGSRGRRKNRSKSRHRSRSKAKAETQKRAATAKRNRSPSLEVVAQPKRPGQPLRALPAPPTAAAAAKKLAPQKPADDVARRAARIAAKRKLKEANVLALPAPVENLDEESSDEVQELQAPEQAKKDVAQAGMVAAAALGFSVLPKVSVSNLQEPAPGLRPSVRPAEVAAGYGAGIVTSGRVCMAYLQGASCRLGEHCPDKHITDPEEEMQVRREFKMRECNMGANCTRHGCLFRHPGEKVD